MYSQPNLSCGLPELETLLKFTAVGGVRRLSWRWAGVKKENFLNNRI